MSYNHSLLLAALAAAGVLFFDWYIELGVAAAVPYVLVVWLVYFARDSRAIWVTAAACTLLTGVGFALSPSGGELWKVLANRGLALVVIWLTALLCVRNLRQMERYAQQEVERRAQSVFEAAPLGMIMVDSAGCISLINDQVEKMFGYSRDELVGESVDRLVPERYREAHPEYRRTFASHTAARPMGEGRNLYGARKDGSEFPVEIGLNPIATDEGLFVIAAITDITVRKKADETLRQYARDLEAEVVRREQAEDELERKNRILETEANQRKLANTLLKRHARRLAQSNEELEQFAYVASHDLQEPLRSVTGFLQLLQRRYADQLDEKAGGYITRSLEGAERMKALIKALLDYSRVTTQGGESEPTDLGAVATQVVSDLRRALEESGGQVLYGELPTVEADPVQVRQLLQNLIGNALKFRGEAAPEVRVSANVKEGEQVISVADNGIGMEPQYAERIFHIFQRLHTRDEYEGTGIGLAMCKKIVERHDGRIWVESEPGRGSAFHFTLPVIEGNS